MGQFSVDHRTAFAFLLLICETKKTHTVTKKNPGYLHSLYCKEMSPEYSGSGDIVISRQWRTKVSENRSFMVLSDRSQIGPIDIYNREGPGTQKSLNGKIGEIFCVIFLNALSGNQTETCWVWIWMPQNMSINAFNAMYDKHLSSWNIWFLLDIDQCPQLDMNHLSILQPAFASAPTVFVFVFVFVFASAPTVCPRKWLESGN